MKRFKMTHLFFPNCIKEFDESNPPDWLIHKGFKWWWDDYILTLEVGQTRESDFQKIERIE